MYALEREEFEREIERYNRLLTAAKANDLVFVGNSASGEIGVYSMKTHEVEWFLELSKATDYCKQQQPEANWEETGW